MLFRVRNDSYCFILQDSCIRPALYGRAAVPKFLLVREERVELGLHLGDDFVDASSLQFVVELGNGSFHVCILAVEETAAVFPMRWGYQMEGRSTLLINARVETAAEKPSFRDSWLHHRCILPASRYFEWQHTPGEDGKTTTTKYAIQPYDTHITWLCGLYRIENGLPAFVVLTSEPSPDVAHIHDRMPLILPKGAVRDWVNPRVRAEDLLPYALTRLEARPER